MRIAFQFIFVFIIVTFSGCNYTTSQPQNTTIYIQPFYPFSHERVTQAATEIQNFYHCKVVVLPECKIYDEARSKSGRYSAPILLDLLDKKVRTKDSKILALTSYDIFHEDHGVKEWGIFGLGNCPGNSCVVSDFRLKWFPEKTPEFTIKIILHELGHTFGLPHCDHDDRCLMNDAKGGIAPLYKERKILCSRCLNKLGIKAK